MGEEGGRAAVEPSTLSIGNSQKSARGEQQARAGWHCLLWARAGVEGPAVCGCLSARAAVLALPPPLLFPGKGGPGACLLPPRCQQCLNSPQPSLPSSPAQVLGAALRGSSRAAPRACGGRVPRTLGGCSRAAQGSSSRGQWSGKGAGSGHGRPGGRALGMGARGSQKRRPGRKGPPSVLAHCSLVFYCVPYGF